MPKAEPIIEKVVVPVDKVVENLKKFDVTDDKEVTEIKLIIEKLAESMKKSKEGGEIAINRDLFR